MHELSLPILIFFIAIALAFDFINGFHDAANSIATVVSTRVLSPRTAVMWAAFFNFLAAFAFGTAVAKMIARGIVMPDFITVSVVMCGVLGAIVWDLITWWMGLPTSSSHALIGGFAGAAVAQSGFQAIVYSGFTKVVAAIFISPGVGLFLGFLLMLIVSWTCRKMAPSYVDRWFRKLQLASSAIFSFSHGSNDAQKTMGIIVALMAASGHLPKDAPVPIWVIFSCHGAIALGTYFGGWKIVKTMGMKIAKLRPVDGFCAETGGGVIILLMSHLGIPVSTTQTITGAIVGVGATRRVRAVRWGIASRIVWAWIFTIPAAAIIAAVCMMLLKFVGLH
ncbi:MAG: inorganic phosphate transporter [Deltaproteobacteria bacterium]|nr:inorganic phosphate transporter [Deltaproteobacteria bacterium]